MYHWCFLLEITVVKIMNNLTVCSTHSYLYPRSRFLKLKSSLQKFYGCHHDLVNIYGISISQMTTDIFHLS
jgi:hypothetical protein